ncbi:right-handed parallel beta-helix repeat-containing protein [Microbulbifer sp. ZKSA002]|uniref:right-handed parallel beta-helix repeat-containing protein n=1 Tax=Microbulbifer sp. ZKSA002 TaxID=3243388 RepID=UPI00403A0D4F
MAIWQLQGIKCTLSIFAGASCLLISGLASAVDCGDTIYTREVLDDDLVCTDNIAITIVGPTGGLDMNGHTITCDNNSAIGIDVVGLVGYLEGAGTISFCQTGVRLAGDGFHNVTNISANNNDFVGLAVSSDFNLITNSSANGNGNTGILVTGLRNTLISNIIESNLLDGIQLDGDAPNLTQNYIYDNNRYGIYIADSSFGNYSQNTSEMNGSVGIYMEADNQFFNYILNNTSESNTDFDLEELNANACSNTNVWLGNTFTTANPSCLN